MHPSQILAMMFLGMMCPQANARGTGLKIGAMDTALIMAKIITFQMLLIVLTLAMSTVNVLGSTPRMGDAPTGDRVLFPQTPLLDTVVTARRTAHCLRLGLTLRLKRRTLKRQPTRMARRRTRAARAGGAGAAGWAAWAWAWAATTITTTTTTWEVGTTTMGGTTTTTTTTMGGTTTTTTTEGGTSLVRRFMSIGGAEW